MSDGNPPCHVALPNVVQRRRVEPVQVAALVEARERNTVVHDDVGARRVLHPGARAPAVGPRRCRRVLGEPGPQRPAGVLLRDEAVGADESVAVEGLSVSESDGMHHRVTVERVIDLQRRMDRVLGVAQVDAVEVVRNLADHLAVVAS